MDADGLFFGCPPLGGYGLPGPAGPGGLGCACGRLLAVLRFTGIDLTDKGGMSRETRRCETKSTGVRRSQVSCWWSKPLRCETRSRRPDPAVSAFGGKRRFVSPELRGGFLLVSLA